MKAANQRARLDPMLEIAGGFAVAAVLVFIGWRIVKGQTTIGDFTGFVTALLLAAQSMRTLGNLNAILQEAVASALQRVFARARRDAAKSWKSRAPQALARRHPARFHSGTLSLALWRGCGGARRASTS